MTNSHVPKIHGLFVSIFETAGITPARRNNMKKIWNATPHSINVIGNTEFDSSIRKYVCRGEAEITASIDSTGMLSAKIDTVDSEPMGNIPVFSKAVVGCDPLPTEMTDEDIIIVSALYASAYRKVYGDDPRLYTIADPVYTPDGKTILGSRGICPAF